MIGRCLIAFVNDVTDVLNINVVTVSDTGSNIVLRQVSVPYIPRALCNRYLGGQVSYTMLCAGGARNKGMCFGDSGGPLVYYTRGRYRLQGVVSWTSGIRGVPKSRMCAYPQKPGVYVDVRRFLGFIRYFTGGKSLQRSGVARLDPKAVLR